MSEMLRIEPVRRTDATPAEDVPRGALVAAAGILLLTVLAVAAVRLSGVDVRAPDAPAVQARELRFVDRPDGGIDVIDARTEAVVDRIAGEQGFLRGTLRAATRERRLRGIGPDQPFELVARADGRLTLIDPAAGTRIDLESFGPTNLATFARLLDPDNRVEPAWR